LHGLTQTNTEKHSVEAGPLALSANI